MAKIVADMSCVKLGKGLFDIAIPEDVAINASGQRCQQGGWKAYMCRTYQFEVICGSVMSPPVP